MSKNKKVLMLLTGGGMTQAEVAAAAHVSKRDVAAAAKVVRENGLTHDAVSGMDPDAVDELLFPSPAPPTPGGRLQIDAAALLERKKANRKLPAKLMWLEHCEAAEEADKRPYSYQAFCRALAAEAERTGATRHFEHEPGAKAYVDWAGDTATVADRAGGAASKVYVLVVCLPFSDYFYAEGFADMRQRSFQEGQARAFRAFGGVPRMLVPDNCATATNRSAARVTLVNAEYGRFAEHHGAAVVPARVRRPRDKSVAESTVDLVERWVVAPSRELTFYTLAEFNEFCAGRVAWLNSRPFAAKDGSRESVFLEEERGCLLPLPAEPYEMCEWRSAKVAPDYHVTVEYMHYSVPCALIGETLDVRLSDTSVEVMRGGETVASHARLRGRKGQYSTVVDHMPPNHRELPSPWSRERFESWADRIGPETGEAVRRLLDSKPVVEQAFVACSNVLGLAKTYSPGLLERACARLNAAGALPSLTGCRNAVLAEKARAASGAPAPGAPAAAPADRAKASGRVRGAGEYRREG